MIQTTYPYGVKPSIFSCLANDIRDMVTAAPATGGSMRVKHSPDRKATISHRERGFILTASFNTLAQDDPRHVRSAKATVLGLARRESCQRNYFQC